MMPQAQLDTRALEKATRVEAMMDMHQVECEKRQADIVRRFEAGSDKMDNLATTLNVAVSTLSQQMALSKQEQASTLNKGLTAIITLLVFALGYFLMTFGLPGSQHNNTISNGGCTSQACSPSPQHSQ